MQGFSLMDVNHVLGVLNTSKVCKLKSIVIMKLFMKIQVQATVMLSISLVQDIKGVMKIQCKWSWSSKKKTQDIKKAEEI